MKWFPFKRNKNPDSSDAASQPVDRSDSGPVGVQVHKVMGLEDDDYVTEVTDETFTAIAAEGLVDLKPIGCGGYGIVFKAVDSTTGNERAIKVMRPRERAKAREVFDRECKMLDAAEMPLGIAPQFYVARQVRTDQPFMIIEWIPGQQLQNWLDARTHLPMNDRISLCRLIFATYAKLHAANLMQRDVSLGNIMVSGRRIRLIDFGGGGRAKAGYRNMSTMSQAPMTEAFAPDAVLAGHRKQTIPDEVHMVAKVCFTVLTGQLAFKKSYAQRKAVLQAAGVPREFANIVLIKTEQPPEKLALQSEPQEF